MFKLFKILCVVSLIAIMLIPIKSVVGAGITFLILLVILAYSFDKEDD